MRSGAIWVALHRGNITIDASKDTLMTLHPDSLAYPPRGMSATKPLVTSALA
jgi:hypothetical protein